MAEVTVYGAPWCPDSRRTKRFLGEARVDFEWVDIDRDPEAAAFVLRKSAGKLTIPVVVLGGGHVLVAPSPAELAAELDIEAPPARRFFDLIIVGAGPTGLSAALHAIREGMHCLVIERGAPGGQAAMTPRLMGSPGFPEGAPGGEVERSLVAQAHRYGLRILRGIGLSGLRRAGDYLVAVTDDDEEFTARSVLIATGAVYETLGVAGEEELRGAGVHFSASSDGPFYRKAEELMVVGAGDLGVQEALFLTQFAGKVRVLEHTSQIQASPLIQEKLRRHPKIAFYTSTEIVELITGEDGKLTEAVVRDRTTGYVFSFNPAAVFVYAGMSPNSDVFKGTVDLDEAGFILTDGAFETSMQGVFAAGDVRAGSTKQLGSALGEGVTAVMMIRTYLQDLGDLAARPSA
ncbi:MAG TPA: FAD-dependent oxidoreductase [Actinomycetota bacterium]